MGGDDVITAPSARPGGAAAVFPPARAGGRGTNVGSYLRHQADLTVEERGTGGAQGGYEGGSSRRSGAALGEWVCWPYLVLQR